jgi:homoserine kinase
MWRDFLLLRDSSPFLLLRAGTISSFSEVKQQVTARVPASTSNLGPGFDCLGVALRLYTSITLWRGKSGPLPSMATETAGKFFAVVRSRIFPFSCAIESDVPIARGLGSSAAIRLGVLHALNELSGVQLSCNELFILCSTLEGHPDNAAAASFGGFNVVRDLKTQRFDVSPRVYFVLLVPDLKIETDKARRLLPAKIPRSDAIMSSSNVAAIVAAFASGDYKNLRGAFRDGLHQPYRERLVPFLQNVIAAAEDSGALGAFLSGSGSSVCAVTLRDPETVAKAMKRGSGLKAARILITTADNQGVRVFKSTARASKI